MSEEKRTHRIDPAWARGITMPRFSRRELFRYVGVGAGSLSLAAVLAACGGDEAGPTGDGGGEDLQALIDEIYAGPAEGPVNFANWPIYIDKAKDKSGERYIPSLRQFTKNTGIEVNYSEIIQDNASFFGKLQPQLQAGDDTGWDIVVISNGREFTALVRNGWAWPLDPDRRPNFDANATGWARDPAFDPGNKYSMAWQSGITGFFQNNDLVNGQVAKLDDLANPDIVGRDGVGMLKSDMPDLVMINLGIDPITSGPEEWRAAADWLLMQRDSGTVRAYTDQGYIDDMTAGNLAAGLAWSGDVLYYNLWAGYPNLEFIFPEGGALLWIDNMMIPANAQHPVAAMEVMDYYFEPEPATMLSEWVLYMSPVKQTQDLIKQHAQEALDEGARIYGNKLLGTAESPYLFPDEAFLSRTSFGRQLETDDEREEWDSIFLPISEGL